MAKKVMTDAEKARAMIDQDFQENPNAPYQDDPEVIDAANSALHSAGNLQRQTYQQNDDADQKELRAKADEKWKQMKAQALASKKGK